MRNSFLLLMSSIFFLTGCSTTFRDTLGYTPITKRQEKNHISLRIKEIDDGRSEGQQIGVVKNLYGMTMFKVTTGESVPNWIKDAIRVELINAGYSIVDSDFPNSYFIEGKVNKVFADTCFSTHTCLSIEISLKKGEEILFQKNYEFKHNKNIKFTNEENNIVEYATITETLKYNLQEVCKYFIADINQYFLDEQRNGNPTL